MDGARHRNKQVERASYVLRVFGVWMGHAVAGHMHGLPPPRRLPANQGQGPTSSRTRDAQAPTYAATTLAARAHSHRRDAGMYCMYVLCPAPPTWRPHVGIGWPAPIAEGNGQDDEDHQRATCTTGRACDTPQQGLVWGTSQDGLRLLRPRVLDCTGGDGLAAAAWGATYPGMPKAPR